jgi:hypothetical protein
MFAKPRGLTHFAALTVVFFALFAVKVFSLNRKGREGRAGGGDQNILPRRGWEISRRTLSLTSPI